MPEFYVNCLQRESMRAPIFADTKEQAMKQLVKMIEDEDTFGDYEWDITDFGIFLQNEEGEEFPVEDQP